MQLDPTDYSSYEGWAIIDAAHPGFPLADAVYGRESNCLVASITACG